MKAGRPRTIDEYLARVRDDHRAALEDLRATIKQVAPAAEECISYGIPAFRLNGMLVGFGATSKHCAFYLMSATTVDAHVSTKRSTFRPMRCCTTVSARGHAWSTAAPVEASRRTKGV